MSQSFSLSAIYTGFVRHQRHEPVRHAFKYRTFMMYLNLDELPELFDCSRWWSAKGWAPGQFRRSDYHGDSAIPLGQSVKNTIKSVTGSQPEGPICMLTHLRYWGYCFNPVTFYYLYDQAGEKVETIMAEITNTPWGERRALIFSPDLNLGSDAVKRYRFQKDFHVSPFWPLNHQYDWRFQSPGATLIVHMKNLVPDQLQRASDSAQNTRVVFDATLSLKRLPVNSVNLRRVLWSYPLMTLKVIFGIHWQAARLYLKRAGYKKHPATLGNPGDRHRTGAAFPMKAIRDSGTVNDRNRETDDDRCHDREQTDSNKTN